LTLAIAVALASLWGLLGGCREQGTAPIDRNQAPETFITSAPGDSQTSFYRVDIHWWGSDIDGAVSAFDVAVTESLPTIDNIQWHRTLRNDSTITFPVEETREVFGHRFYVRAIDNEGKVDPTPCWVFFGAKDNVSPTVQFTESTAFNPNGQTKTITSVNPDFPTDTIPTGWGVRFRWRGVDLDRVIDSNGDTIQVGRVKSFSYRLLPIETGYIGGDSTFLAAEYPPALFAQFPHGSVYAFNVRAIDDAGLSGSGTVTRSFVWNLDPVSRIYDPSGVYRRSFLSRGVMHVAGDTLPVSVPGNNDLPDVEFTATGFDPDPLDGVDHSVASLEWRYTSGANTTPWTAFSGIETLSDLRTGDYIAMVRSQDRLLRYESSPDSLIFSVNLSPRFITHGGDSIPGFDQVPLPGAVYDTTSLANGLSCTFCADDRDVGIGGQVKFGYIITEDNYVVVTYVNNNLGVVPETPVTFRAVRYQNRKFSPGNYHLQVIVEDNAQPGGSDARGVRTSMRTVPFTVVP
jgi:hypothetical protein